MPATYPSSIINARLQIVANAIDGGGGNGNLRILDGGGSILSTIALARPCGTVSGGVLTFAGIPLVDPAAAASGSASSARIEDSGSNIVASGLTVGGAGVTGVDVVLSNGLGTTFIGAGQSIALTAASITGH